MLVNKKSLLSLISIMMLLMTSLLITGCGDKEKDTTVYSKSENQKEVVDTVVKVESKPVNYINYFEEKKLNDSVLVKEDFFKTMIQVDSDIMTKSYVYGSNDGRTVIICLNNLNDEAGESLYYAYVYSLKSNSELKETAIDSELSIYEDKSAEAVFFSFYTQDKKNYIYIACDISQYDTYAEYVSEATNKTLPDYL